MSDDEAPPAKVRKATDKQMAGLRKGMEALKAKREALAKEREVHEEYNLFLLQIVMQILL